MSKTEKRANRWETPKTNTPWRAYGVFKNRNKKEKPEQVESK